jgi:sugar phosphate isomerase/epimerase
VLASGDIRVERVTEILRAGALASSEPAVQLIAAGEDLSQLDLEPIVLQLAAVAWSPAQIQAAADRMLATMRANAQALDAEQAALIEGRAAELQDAQQQAQREIDKLQESLARIREHRESLNEQRQALEAAHKVHLGHMAHLDEQDQLLVERRKQHHQAVHAQNIAEQRDA